MTLGGNGDGGNADADEGIGLFPLKSSSAWPDCVGEEDGARDVEGGMDSGREDTEGIGVSCSGEGSS